jgi:hypothetical protein
MHIFDNDEDFPFPIWTTDDVEVLETIEHFWAIGLVELLQFLIDEQGIFQDETLDISVVIHSVINSLKDQYSFDQVDTIVSIASEFCLINSRHDKQNLSSIELTDNAILYLALQEEDDLALEGALIRSEVPTSIFSAEVTRPALSLFGHWEDLSGMLLFSMLTRGVLHDTIGSTFKYVSTIFTNELEFVDLVRKLCDVGLLSTEILESGEARVKIEIPAAGIFLLLSNRTDLASQLAHLSI